MDARDHDKTLETPEAQQDSSTGGGNGALRIYWMAIGNVALLILAGLISQQPVWTITLLDAGYVLVVGTLLISRYLDVKRYGGETANGEPATSSHLVRYGVGVTVLGAALWGLVQSVTA